jgi:hypothetical protein
VAAPFPSYRASTNTTYASRTNTVVNLPTGTKDGDLLLLWHLLGNATPPTPTITAGWTLVPGLPTTQTVSGFSVTARLWYRFANGEPTSYTITHTVSNSQAYLGAYQGVSAALPLNPTPTVNKGINTTSTYTGLTTLANNCLVVLIGHDWGDFTNNLTPPTGTTPTFTERLDVTLSYVADGTLATAGATGNKSMTNNCSSISGWQVVMLSLPPAPPLPNNYQFLKVGDGMSVTEKIK